jgi:hypothetical protein
LSGGEITLGSANTTITANATATIGSVLGGANSLLTNGNSTLSLTVQQYVQR